MGNKNGINSNTTLVKVKLITMVSNSFPYPVFKYNTC